MYRHASVYAGLALRSSQAFDLHQWQCVCMQMPAVAELKTPEYLKHLQQQDTDQSLWEVGASCNFLIAAARLGMCSAAVANLGDDVYGKYLLDILQVWASGLSPNWASSRKLTASSSHLHCPDMMLHVTKGNMPETWQLSPLIPSQWHYTVHFWPCNVCCMHPHNVRSSRSYARFTELSHAAAFINARC